MSASLAVEHFASYFRPESLLALRSRPHSSSSSNGTWQQQEHLWEQRQQPLRKTNLAERSVVTLKVPGRTFPVSVNYLSEVLKMLDPDTLPASYRTASAAAAAVASRYKGGRLPATKTEWKEQQQGTSTADPVPADKLANAAAAAAAVSGAPASALPQLPQLVAAVVRHVHITGTPCALSSSTGSKGFFGGAQKQQRQRQQQQQREQNAGTAIIVFCSGVGEVAAVCRAIEELQMDLWVLPCHASLHASQQQKAS